MDIYAQIKGSIKEIVGKTKLVLSIAKVVSVDGDVCTCELDGLQVSDVRLRAVLNGKSERILITPKKDSYVLVYDMSSLDVHVTDVLDVLALMERRSLPVATNKVPLP